MSANQNFQVGIKDHPAIKSVFANYRLISTAWIQANTLKPGDGNLDAETIASIDLANSTLETFVQSVGTNCFSCHNNQRRQKLSRQGHKPQSCDLERPAK
jgi:hypothetical protein